MYTNVGLIKKMAMFKVPKGGYFVWAKLPDGIDTLLADRDKEHREYVYLFRLSHSEAIDVKLRARKQLS